MLGRYAAELALEQAAQRRVVATLLEAVSHPGEPAETEVFGACVRVQVDELPGLERTVGSGGAAGEHLAHYACGRVVTLAYVEGVEIRGLCGYGFIGGLLGVESFETTPYGYRQLLAWLRSLGEALLLTPRHDRQSTGAAPVGGGPGNCGPT